MTHRLIKIGIIGPRSYVVGGHDFTCEERTDLRDQIKRILVTYQEGAVVMGITGLGLGIEQDFALSCIECNIDYQVILPFEKQGENWSELPMVQRFYEELTQKAIEIIALDPGQYTPRKIIKKDNIIIDKADVIIQLHHPRRPNILSVDKKIHLLTL